MIFNNHALILVGAAIMLDTVLGILRAAKERRFNSSAGINGAIRKVAMMACIAALAFADNLVNFNLLFAVPQEWLAAIGWERVGLCEFFSLLFILYEATSILKNMVLCGIPIPQKIRNRLSTFLKEMTSEL